MYLFMQVWDMRTKACIHTLTGHTNTVGTVFTQAPNPQVSHFHGPKFSLSISLSSPQVVTGSHDCTIRLWDLAAGKTKAVLTNHKKSVRALVLHPSE